MNLIHLFDDQARRFPDRAALIEGLPDRERCTTFAQLYRDSCQIAALFNQQGLKPGQYVLIALPVSSTLYAVIAAAFRFGLIPVFIDPTRGMGFVRQVLRELTVHALVASPKAMWITLLHSPLRQIRCKFVSGYFPGAISLASARQLPPLQDALECKEDTPALITFTSGTTGMPKGVIRTHGNLFHSHRVLSTLFGFTPGTVHLASMPIMVLTSLIDGIGSLLPAIPLSKLGSADPQKLIAQLQAYQPENTVITPGLLSLITAAATEDNILSCFRNIVIGGAPLMPRQLERIHTLAANATVKVLYGSTEAEPIASVSYQAVNEADVERMNTGYGLLVGQPVAGIELRIIREQCPPFADPITAAAFEGLSQKVDAIGEIVVTGPQVISHYLNGRGEEKAFIQVGDKTWLRTGDAGRLDERGRLWLLGRCAARVEDGDEVYYPLAVEPVVSLVPGVERSAYLLAQGRKVLVLQTAVPFTQSDIQHIVHRVSWARIDEVVLMEAIPVERRLYSKTDYQALRDRLSKGRYIQKFQAPFGDSIEG